MFVQFDILYLLTICSFDVLFYSTFVQFDILNRSTICYIFEVFMLHIWLFHFFHRLFRKRQKIFEIF